jgi:hypothetical protein
MGSIVFQTIRESKALAYSTFVIMGSTKEKWSNYYIGYVGSQADKFKDAKYERITNDHAWVTEY